MGYHIYSGFQENGHSKMEVKRSKISIFILIYFNGYLGMSLHQLYSNTSNKKLLSGLLMLTANDSHVEQTNDSDSLKVPLFCLFLTELMYVIKVSNSDKYILGTAKSGYYGRSSIKAYILFTHQSKMATIWKIHPKLSNNSIPWIIISCFLVFLPILH